jgi:hypothetical protein
MPFRFTFKSFKKNESVDYTTRRLLLCGVFGYVSLNDSFSCSVSRCHQNWASVTVKSTIVPSVCVGAKQLASVSKSSLEHAEKRGY